jgi:hypothetical protein
LADDGGGVTLGGIDLSVEMAHFVGGDFSGEIGEGGAELREFGERGLAHDGNGIVGREIVEVIFERNEMEGFEEAVGGIAGDDVHLMLDESAIEEAEVHDVGRRGEMKIVAGRPAGKAVGAFEEFVADADAPFRSDGLQVGHSAEMEAGGVLAADDHGEGVGEAERFGEVEMKALGVLLLDAGVDGGGSVVGRGGFVEDGGEGRAGVFDVKIEVAGEKRFVDEESAAEIGFADDVDAGAGFDVLGEELGEENLFSEKFGADGDMRRRFGTARNIEREVQEAKEGEEAKERTAHGRVSFSRGKRKR